MLTSMGNLVVNGDFESGDIDCAPDDWESSNVAVVGPERAFTGRQAVSLGGMAPTDPAYMFQDVEVCPLRRYQIAFQYGAFDGPAGPVVCEVRWLDAFGADLGPGFRMLLLGRESSNDKRFWQACMGLTDVSPTKAALARVLFTRGTAPPFTGPATIDAVSFAEIT